MTDSPRPTPPTWQLAVAFAILYIVWGTTYLAIQIGVLDEQMPPLLFGGTRICCAGLILLVFQFIRGQQLRFSAKDAVGMFASSLLMLVVGNGLISIALQTVKSGESAVLAATTTLWIALFGMTFAGGDRLRPLGWLGLLVGLAGVVVLQLPKLAEQGVGFARNIGPWLTLISAASWGIGTVLVRHTTIRLPRLSSMGWQMSLAGAVMVGAGFLYGESIPARVSGRAIGAFLYLLIVGSLIAFVAFHWLLEYVSAPKVGTYAYVNPLVAVLLGAWLHDEPISRALIGGMTLILAGVFLVRGGDRPTIVAVEPEPDESEVAAATPECQSASSP